MNQAAEHPEDQQQPRGRLQGKQNVYWKEGDVREQPRFRGTFTLPNNPEPRAFSLWVNIPKEDPADPDKKRNTYLSGHGSDTATSALDKMANKEPPMTDEQKIALTQHTADGFAVKPKQIILFQAKRPEKDGQPENGKQPPNLYGYYNPADGTPLQRIDVWMRPSGGDRFELSGNVTEYDFAKHLERLNEREQQNQLTNAPAAPDNDNGEGEEEEPSRKRGRSR